MRSVVIYVGPQSVIGFFMAADAIADLQTRMLCAATAAL